MKKKKLLALGMVAALGTTAVVGGTLAYFTDTDSKENTFTSGNVKIVQHEQDRLGNDYGTDTKKLLPSNYSNKKDDKGYYVDANYIDKIVTVTNTGSEDAYVRTYVAIPAALDDGPTTFDANKNILHWNGASANDKEYACNINRDNEWYWTKDLTHDWPTDENGAEWNFYQSKIDDVLYNVYVATHFTKLEATGTTAPSLRGVYLDSNVDCRTVEVEVAGETQPQTKTEYYIKGADGTEEKIIDLDNVKVLVATEAVQAAGFVEDTNANGTIADEALDAAFKAVGKHCPFGGEVQ